MKTEVSILGKRYPVEISWKSSQAYQRLIKLYGIQDFETKKKAYCYSAFIAGKHTAGGDFRFMFSDFCRFCEMDNIVDSIGELIEGVDTTACNLAVFWLDNKCLN